MCQISFNEFLDCSQSWCFCCNLGNFGRIPLCTGCFVTCIPNNLLISKNFRPCSPWRKGIFSAYLKPYSGEQANKVKIFIFNIVGTNGKLIIGKRYMHVYFYFRFEGRQIVCFRIRRNYVFVLRFDVLLTVHLSIILEINQLNAQILSQPVKGTATYRCDDTRCCIIQFWPPDYEHTVLETCRGI